MSFKRKTESALLKNGLFSGALFLSGVVEFFDRLEDGESVGQAALGAIDETREATETLQDAARKKRVGGGKRRRKIGKEKRS